MLRRDNPTVRRRRKVRWAHRLRRLGHAWDNALEIARAGRLTAPYGAPFEVVHDEQIYRLRRYAPHPEGVDRIAAPLLLVPPLMVASEVYDISPDVSAVAYLTRAGVDVWLVDFGAPERERGGMERTLDDHVRAVSEAVDRVCAATGQNVHLVGYSQGGMFCYQAGALRRSANVASIVALGSPVDLRRHLPLDENAMEHLTAGLRAAIEWPLTRMEGLPGAFTSTGFKVLSARKELTQIVEFVKNLHDRSALEKREAKRLFLGGDGFVAWPGPAFRKFVDDVIVENRLASGGFVVDGRTVTLADLTCPILYFVGTRDAMGRPGSVRGIRHAAPHATRMYELLLKAGHFGLVVGSTALAVTWPSVVEWMKHVAGNGPLPKAALDVRADESPPVLEDDHLEHDSDVEVPGDSTIEFAKQLVTKAASVAVDQINSLTENLGHYIDHVRWQLPRITRLTYMRDDTLVSVGQMLSTQARTIGERTFFLWRGRAFTYAEANKRVDAVVRGLIACGITPGARVAVLMKSRPSHLSVVCALNRLGAVAVLLPTEIPDPLLSRALELTQATIAIADPDTAARAQSHAAGTPASESSTDSRPIRPVRVLVLGGVGEQGDPLPGVGPAARTIPRGAIDLEAIDPDTVELPAWYKPDFGRSRDLAMIFVSVGRGEQLRANKITNGRWAFSALGAAAAATLTIRDTVYCCLPLHHPSGTMVAAGSALASGARLALASRFGAPTFWDEVRRYGVTVVFYAGEMCRLLVDAPTTLGENNHPIRLFAGSGMRPDVWRRLVKRFGPVAVLEMYASTEVNAVLANAAGHKVGSVGQPLPGSTEIAIAAWNTAENRLERDDSGRLVRARIDEPGMLICKLTVDDNLQQPKPATSDDSQRILHDVFESGDRWFATGDLVTVDAAGDHWFIDRLDQMIKTRGGWVASRGIEDVLYAAGGVALCIASGTLDGDHEVPVAAIQLRRKIDHHQAVRSDTSEHSRTPLATLGSPRRGGSPGRGTEDGGRGTTDASATFDLDAVSAAVRTLPEYARPRQLYIIDQLPMTEGFRVIRDGFVDREIRRGHCDYVWDNRSESYLAKSRLVSLL